MVLFGFRLGDRWGWYYLDMVGGVVLWSLNNNRAFTPRTLHINNSVSVYPFAGLYVGKAVEIGMPRKPIGIRLCEGAPIKGFRAIQIYFQSICKIIRLNINNLHSLCKYHVNTMSERIFATYICIGKLN